MRTPVEIGVSEHVLSVLRGVANLELVLGNLVSVLLLAWLAR